MSEKSNIPKYRVVVASKLPLNLRSELNLKSASITAESLVEIINYLEKTYNAEYVQYGPSHRGEEPFFLLRNPLKLW